MIDQTPTNGQPPTRAALLEAFEALKDGQPKMRTIDAAERLGVSEAELLAARTSDDIIRLDGDWAALITDLPALGEVMALTRNADCVHEKYGTFDNISIGPGHGLVLNDEIDLRLFMRHWRYGFAVTEEVPSGRRHSLQFFDIDGRAVHKIYVTDQSEMGAYWALVETYRAIRQHTPLNVMPVPPGPQDGPDETAPRDTLLSHWDALQDTHDFFGMLNEFGVSRLQAMRLAEGRFTRRLHPDAARLMLERAAETGLPIMCFVGNPGCIQIHTGPVKTIRPSGPWINVLDARFNLHLREDSIVSAWQVIKPTRDGNVTSIELYNAENSCFVQFFGERKPGRAELDAWRDLVSGMPGIEQQEAAE